MVPVYFAMHTFVHAYDSDRLYAMCMCIFECMCVWLKMTRTKSTEIFIVYSFLVQILCVSLSLFILDEITLKIQSNCIRALSIAIS